MHRLDALIRSVSTYAAWGAGALLILSAVGVSIEVILRKALNISVGGATELSGYALAIISSWAFAFTLVQRGHVRIDTLYRLLPLRARAVIDVLAIACLLGFMAVVTERAAHVLQVSIQNGTISTTPLATPMWIPQSLWLLGLLMFLAVLVYLFIRAATRLLRRDFRGVTELVGPFTTEDEIEEQATLAKTVTGGGSPHADEESGR